MNRNHNWYDLNSTRRYPIDDGATGEDDRGFELPNNLLVDCRIDFPNVYGRYLYLAGITVTPTIVTAVFAASHTPAVVPASSCNIDYPENDYTPVAAVSIAQPVGSGIPYAVEPLLEGTAGWVVFGSGVKETYQGRFESVRQSMILPRCAIGGRPIGVSSVGKLGGDAPFDGIVRLSRGSDFEIVKLTRSLDACSRSVLVFRLQASTVGQNVLDAYRGPCDVRPESDTCLRPGIERVGPAVPDCDGNITIDFRQFVVGATPVADGAIVLDFDVGMAEMCGDNLPVDGRLPNAYGDQCYVASLSSLSLSSSDSLSLDASITSEESISVESIECRELPILETFDFLHHGFTTISGVFNFSKVDSPWESSSQIFSGWSSWSSSSSSLLSIESSSGSLRSYDSSLTSCFWSSLSLRSSSSGHSDSSSEIYSSSSLSSSSSLDSSSEIHFSSSDYSSSSLCCSSSIYSSSEVLGSDSLSSSSSLGWPPSQPSELPLGHGICDEDEETTGLALAVPFWTGSGNVVRDVSTYGWSFTKSGLAWSSASYGGYAGSFTGSGNALASNVEPGALGVFTLIALFRTETLATQTILGFNDEISENAGIAHVSLQLANDGNLQLQWSANGTITHTVGTTGRNFADDQWHLVIVERQGATVAIRVDGYNVGGGTATTAGAAASVSSMEARWTIGSKGHGSLSPSQQFTGEIGLVAAYDRLLPYSERVSWFENPWFIFRDCRPDRIQICRTVQYVDVHNEVVLIPVYRPVMVRRSRLVRQDAKWSLAAVDLSKRNVAILDDCGYEDTLEKRYRADIMIPAPNVGGQPGNGGLIINHRQTGFSYQHFYVQLDIITQTLGIRRFNGSSLQSPLPVSDPIPGIKFDDWYRLTVTTNAGPGASEVTMRCRLQGLTDPSIDVTLIAASTNYLPATGKFGIASDRALAHFSYVELAEA